MKARRYSLGQEAFEVGMIGVVLLCLSIGATMVFGGSIQKVFQSQDSPIIISATKMQNSSNVNDADGAESRTNIDKSLVTSQLVTKTRQDLSIGSAVGQETTGATGGDSAIGGTSKLDYFKLLHDTDLDTMENQFLADAIRAKKSALQLLSDAMSSEGLAGVLENKAKGLQVKADQGLAFLTQLQSGLNSLTNEVGTVDNHLKLLVELKAAAEDVQINVTDALNYTDSVNNDIIAQTALNLAKGKALLQLNLDQIAAQNLYQAMKADYENSWTTTCDIDGNCTDVNTSQYTIGQINGQLSTSNMLLAEVNGKAAAIGVTVDQLEDVVASLETQADQAHNQAQQLKDDAKKTMKSAFYNPHLFDGCYKVEDIIKRAEWALGQGGKKVKDADAALKAIGLLKDSAKAYKNAKKLKADAHDAHDNLKDQKETLAKLDVDAANLSLQANKAETNSIIDKQQAAYAALAAADPEIKAVTKELGKIQKTAADASLSVQTQQANVTQLTLAAQNAASEAAKVKQEALNLKEEAKNSVVSATETIDEILNYSD